MNPQFNHLIAKHGVMASFSIARKVSRNDIKKITEKIKKKYNGNDKEKFADLLQKEILNKTEYSMNHDLIPGLIYSETPPPPHKEKITFKDEKKVIKLNYIADVIAKKLIDNKFSKDEICYLVLTLLSGLGLNDKDFKDFHQKYNTNNESDDIEDDDDDDDPINS